MKRPAGVTYHPKAKKAPSASQPLERNGASREETVAGPDTKG